MSPRDVSQPMGAPRTRDLPFYPPPRSLAALDARPLVDTSRRDLVETVAAMLVTFAAVLAWGLFLVQVLVMAKGGA